MSKFVGVFRELASFNELLHTQVELILVERLHRNWLKVRRLFSCHSTASCHLHAVSIVRFIQYLTAWFQSHVWLISGMRLVIMSQTTV